MSRLWSNAPNLPHPSEAFDGETYQAERDHARLTGQWLRVWNVMTGYGNGTSEWLTLRQISMRLSHCDSEAAISARLRDFRKAKFGGHTVERRYIANGLHEYRLIVKGRKAA